jgi:hypothetical protein
VVTKLGEPLEDVNLKQENIIEVINIQRIEELEEDTIKL